MTNLNPWTIAGIITAALTYFLIQKGSVVNAEKNRTLIENKLETVTRKAIKSIEETAKATKKKINSSATSIIEDLEFQTNNLSSEIDKLSIQARKATQTLNQEIKEKANVTQNEIRSSRFKIPKQIIYNVTLKIDLKKNNLDSYLKEILKEELFNSIINYRKNNQSKSRDEKYVRPLRFNFEGEKYKFCQMITPVITFYKQEAPLCQFNSYDEILDANLESIKFSYYQNVDGDEFVSINYKIRLKKIASPLTSGLDLCNTKGSVALTVYKKDHPTIFKELKEIEITAGNLKIENQTLSLSFSEKLEFNEFIFQNKAIKPFEIGPNCWSMF